MKKVYLSYPAEVIEFTPTKWSKEFEGALFADSGVSPNEDPDD
ncbi:MAG: hypothetical protein SFT93_05605 [Rickettsiaceae bacterium]|nr:hypothetical protein [Rickettsiaceae bacterium]